LPYEYVILDVPGDIAANSICSILPNPAGSSILLRFGSLPFGLHFRLCDISGKVLKEGDIWEAETCIPLNGLPASVYILAIMSEHKTMAVYKILKQ
jgi:hypothetical protein